MASKALNSLKRRVLFQRNGLTAAEKNIFMIRIVGVELAEMKEPQKAASLAIIEQDLDTNTKNFDDVLSELTMVLRDRAQARRQLNEFLRKVIAMGN
jgi:hypothetical protein